LEKRDEKKEAKRSKKKEHVIASMCSPWCSQAVGVLVLSEKGSQKRYEAETQEEAEEREPMRVRQYLLMPTGLPGSLSNAKMRLGYTSNGGTAPLALSWHLPTRLVAKPQMLVRQVR
jgi:hypothetical protein